MNHAPDFSEFADASVDLRNGLSSSLSKDLHDTWAFWCTHFEAYNPRVVFKPENLGHTIAQLKRIDRSGLDSTIVSFVRMSLQAVGMPGKELDDRIRLVEKAVYGQDD